MKINFGLKGQSFLYLYRISVPSIGLSTKNLLFYFLKNDPSLLMNPI